ncbi:endonuclease/exonuclease/phosphatase family protein [Marilutibacter chinensis]|uniref:Endonuclease/exonuclease/phosphatase family protein n=1 Tax=Marilutibacter chinensis TaxID=2912247 RepID=A0ABS9HMF9_9GAMM|nr:endonuclease/exonuclease/phosphatase family protein [Lysobacter chinensis]MCF7220216.1 endonuclease/exonuclease/phosphatase family protein [Lysobacter chinensis]
MRFGRGLVFSVSLAVLLLAGPPPVAAADDGSGDDTAAMGAALDVMTFNLRYAGTRPPNAWAERRPVVLELLRRRAPDLVGTQEGLYRQLIDIDEGLPEYEWIGLGRDGGSHGEFMAVFYRRDRLVPLEYDHFWLSDTPEAIGSRSWGNRFSRMATWVRFRDRQSGCELYALNTHLDHETPAARTKSAQLLVDRVSGFEPGIPVVLLGDFNAATTGPEAADQVYATLTAEGAFVDTWNEAGQGEPAFGTFHDFGGTGNAAGGARIDWILTRGAFVTRSAGIDTFARDGQYPSDHFPVTARVETPRCR